MEQSAGHEFIQVTDAEPDPAFSFNLRTLAMKPVITGEITARRWYDWRLPGVLRKEKADLFVAAESYASLRTNIRQLLIVPYLAFLQEKKQVSRAEKIAFFKPMLRKAATVVVPSAFSKAQLVKHTGLPEQKIQVIPAAAGSLYVPVSWAQREQTKVAHAGACEYFLCYGTLYAYRQIGTLLKAFSVFKRWQKSNMKLLIVGETPEKFPPELAILDTYKYRGDVELLDPQTPQTMAQLVAAAYAVVQPSGYEDIGMQALEAMACDVPVIAADSGAIPEICGDAALYAPAGDVDALGQLLIKLYKDEALRSNLIEKGKQRLALYNPDAHAAQLQALAQL